MFRTIIKLNLTSSNKPLRLVVSGLLRRYLCGCPCPESKTSTTSRSTTDIKVAICGANGQVGSIIAFLLKQSPLVDVIRLYDLDCTYGTAMDIAHIDTRCKVQSYSGCKEIRECITDANIIIICAGVGRAPGMCINDLFEYNAPVVKQLAEIIVKVNPTALVGILTNPINSLVPMVAKIFKNASKYDPRKIFGITTIDSMRACSIVVSDILKGGGDPAEFLIPVIGGHSPETMVPVLSQTSPCVEIPDACFDSIVERIQNASYLVTALKKKGGPRLSVALGASRFINNLIRGLKGEKDVMELAFVETPSVPGINFFASPIELGVHGIKNNLGLLKVDEILEKPYLREAVKYLKCDIKRGESYIPDPPSVDTWHNF